MLITCKECELPVSDKAIACPHCGNPMKQSSHSNISNFKKRMRLPNGFGNITEVKGKNLRKPFRAMISIGKYPNGKPQYKIIDYYESYNDAYYALMEYNKNPYDIELDVTVKDLYDKWSEEYFKKIKDNSKRNIICSWSYCDSVKAMRAKDLRPGHIKDCMNTCKSDNMKNRIKSMFNLMCDYGVEYGYLDKNYARDFNIEIPQAKSSHNAFTDKELERLWANTSVPFVNIILLQCYTGWRPQELCNIRRDDCDPDELIMKGGMKTKAGEDRIVPVCEKIKEVFLKLYVLSCALDSEYLICDNDGSKLTYDKYYKRFMVQMAEYQMKHRPHDPRKTFITLCKNAGVDEYAIKHMAGHAINDITEKVYTERGIDWFKKEIEKI